MDLKEGTAMKSVLIDALRASGEVLLSYFDKPLDVKYKESQSSIVTEADIECERVIIDIIQKSFPSHNIVSEEKGLIFNGSEYTWIIDPVDGTSNFAAGVPWYGALIALCMDTTPVMGGAYLPVQDDLYFAWAGEGAFKNDTPIPPIENREMKDMLFAFGVDSSDDPESFKKGVEVYKTLVTHSRNIRATNSLIDFLYVVEGKFGGVVNLNTKIWDIAPFMVMISETGGVLKGIDENDIRFVVDEKLLDKTFRVVAGSDRVVRFFLQA
ncbi:MAG: inositol monophosphatase [Bacteroidales bacterium]